VDNISCKKSFIGFGLQKNTMGKKLKDRFIIPKDFGNVFRLAMIPEFPSLFERNPGDVFQDSYACDDFYVHVLMAYDKKSFA